MLRSLKIQNIALIENLEINFFDGLNVLSGETGSGKSIIINALSFVLGARADKTLIRNGETTARVDALFEVRKDDAKLAECLQELNIAIAPTIIISRKMSIDGKNDIKVNSVSVSLAGLKKLTGLIADIYGQFEHASLLDTKKHIEVLDIYAESEIAKPLENYRNTLEDYNKLKRDINRLGGDGGAREQKLDFLKFQIQEIFQVAPKIGEDIELTNQKMRMQNGEKLALGYSQFIGMIDGDGDNARSLVSRAIKALVGIAPFEPNLESLIERLSSCEIELNDVLASVSDLASNCEFSQTEFEKVDSRLDRINALKKKYGGSIESVLAHAEQAQKDIFFFEDSQANLDKLQAELDSVQNDLQTKAEILSNARREKAKEFEIKIIRELADLGMKNSQFQVDFIEDEERAFQSNGVDNIEFLFSANVGEPLKPLSKIISGGEMSRFMLAIKCLLVRLESSQTMVFDEIDAGISGVMGQVLAIKLSQISQNNQVLTISHLPQITAMADHHYKIFKATTNGKTQTNLELLGVEQSLHEIARLAGGDNVGEHSILHAKDLKNWANTIKKDI